MSEWGTIRAGRRAYDLMYRWWAPWDSVGVRDELRSVLDEGLIDSRSHPRAIDLGCGTGANVVYLACLGFESWGVDFSPVALNKAQARADDSGVVAHFVEGDLTAEEVPGAEGSYDLILDFGTLDDLDADGRRAMAGLITRLSRPGTVVLFWCFYGRREDLPRISFVGPSRISPGIEPGEEQDLFGRHFDILRRSHPGPDTRAACFLMTRRNDPTPTT